MTVHLVHFFQRQIMLDDLGRYLRSRKYRSEMPLAISVIYYVIFTPEVRRCGAKTGDEWSGAGPRPPAIQDGGGVTSGGNLGNGTERAVPQYIDNRNPHVAVADSVVVSVFTLPTT
ncbi:hypothetical protein J6590_006875 [Homalodisca vitripennis]|nr:hypothetical protein J6590_006875 [Homalodisca vitripennis]